MQELITKQVEVIDHAATGAAMREKRMAAGLSLREMGERLHLSSMFLSDLERGQRNWTAERVQQFTDALTK